MAGVIRLTPFVAIAGVELAEVLSRELSLCDLEGTPIFCWNCPGEGSGFKRFEKPEGEWEGCM